MYLPEDVVRKINSYVIDLYYNEHIQTYSKVLEGLILLKNEFIKNNVHWNIKYIKKEGTYHLFLGDSSHLIHRFRNAVVLLRDSKNHTFQYLNIFHVDDEEDYIKYLRTKQVKWYSGSKFNYKTSLSKNLNCIFS